MDSFEERIAQFKELEQEISQMESKLQDLKLQKDELKVLRVFMDSAYYKVPRLFRKGFLYAATHIPGQELVPGNTYQCKIIEGTLTTSTLIRVWTDPETGEDYYEFDVPGVVFVLLNRSDGQDRYIDLADLSKLPSINDPQGAS